MEIGIIGAGYVGLITATILASKNTSKRFTVIESLEKKIEQLKAKQHYIKEPGFEELFDEVFEKNLFVSTSMDDIKNCDIIFIAVGTPDVDGHCNLTYFNEAVESINKVAKENALVIVKSTVPVGTTKKTSEKMRKDLILMNIPEFLAEGSAVNDLRNPVRILIGTTKEMNENDIEKIRSLFSYVDSEKIVFTDSNTSELIKLSSNFILAQRVATINLIENIAKQYKANITDISKILRMDDRIGHKFLSPSAAFGGSCFKKDINNLSSICQDTIFSKYIKSVNVINEYHALLIAEEIPMNSRVLILGYGFKNGTEDTRESPTEIILSYLSSTVVADVYDSHIEKYAKKPLKMDYDKYILMNDEDEYVEMLKGIDKNRIINPRYSSKLQ